MLGASVTLTTHSVAYNLYTLLSAVDSSIPRYCHQIILQWDSGNGAANVYTGSPSLTATTPRGIALNSSVDTMSFQTEFNGFQTDGFYVLSDTDGSVLNVNLEVV